MEEESARFHSQRTRAEIGLSFSPLIFCDEWSNETVLGPADNKQQGRLMMVALKLLLRLKIMVSRAGLEPATR